MYENQKVWGWLDIDHIQVWKFLCNGNDDNNWGAAMEVDGTQSPQTKVNPNHREEFASRDQSNKGDGNHGEMIFQINANCTIFG